MAEWQSRMVPGFTGFQTFLFLMARMCFNRAKLTQLTVIADVKTVKDGSWSGAWANQKL